MRPGSQTSEFRACRAYFWVSLFFITLQILISAFALWAITFTDTDLSYSFTATSINSGVVLLYTGYLIKFYLTQRTLLKKALLEK